MHKKERTKLNVSQIWLTSKTARQPLRPRVWVKLFFILVTNEKGYRVRSKTTFNTTGEETVAIEISPKCPCLTWLTRLALPGWRKMEGEREYGTNLAGVIHGQTHCFQTSIKLDTSEIRINIGLPCTCFPLHVHSADLKVLACTIIDQMQNERTCKRVHHEIELHARQMLR